MNLFLKYKKVILICFSFALILVITIIYFNKNDTAMATSTEIVESGADIQAEIIESQEIAYIYVDIKGEINKPGVYRLEGNKRIEDVIKLAGGLTKNANTRSINLSRVVSDEMVIIIHSKTEIENFIKTEEKEKQLISNCNSDTYYLVNDGCISPNLESKDTKLSINKANVEDLLTLNGVGEAKAKSIINYRTEIGEFKSIEELLNVSGIGEALFAQIKDFITL